MAKLLNRCKCGSRMRERDGIMLCPRCDLTALKPAWREPTDVVAESGRAVDDLLRDPREYGDPR